MKKRTKFFLKDCSGALTIEMALIATLTFFLIPALIDIATIISSNMTIRSSLRAGTQVALVQPSNTAAIREAVVVSSGYPEETVDVDTAIFCECDGITVSCSTPSCSEGITPSTFMTITANYVPDTLLSYPDPNPFAVTKTTTVRVR